MEATALVSLAGLAATVAASGIGFYFTYKAQRTPLRQELFKRQIECLSEFVLHATRMQQLASAFATGNEKFESGGEADLAWESLNVEILEVTQRAGLVLPAAAYSTLTAYRRAQVDFEDAMLANQDLSSPLNAMMGAFGHVFMVGRELIGADNLSAESIRMFGGDGYENMNRIGSTALAKIFAALGSQEKAVR
jgi:hypothetical protein